MRNQNLSSWLAVTFACVIFLTPPAHARFMQTDPVGYADDMDMYTYVQDDPTDKADPTGREASCLYTGGCDHPSGMDMSYLEPFEPVMTFFSGVGPSAQDYKGGTDMARAAQRSVVAGIARGRVERALDQNRTPRNPMGVYFNPQRFSEAALQGDTFSHVMGSVSVTAHMLGEGQVQFSVSNEMTVSSLLGASAFRQLLGMPGVAGQIEKLNHEKGPMATVKITVTWKEQLQKHDCPGTRIQRYGAC